MRNFINKSSSVLAAFVVFMMPLVFAAPVLAASEPTVLTHAPALNSPSGSGTSYNWSGYETTAGTFTGIGATWTVPTVAATSSLSADATWVGIGGVTSHDLIQVGTQAVTGNGADQVQYQAWFETLPQATQQLPLTVNGGDSVTASVTQVASGEWQVAFRDNTTGATYSTQIAYASSLSSAEWIEEAPSDQEGILPLDQFGSSSFSAAYAIENGTQTDIANSGATPLSMANTMNQVAATPSALEGDGASFTISRTSAASTVATMPGGRNFLRGRGHRVGVGIQGFSPWHGNSGGNAMGASYSSSPSSAVPSIGPVSTGMPFTRIVNFGGGQFRIQVNVGGLGQQRQILQFFREQFRTTSGM